MKSKSLRKAMAAMCVGTMVTSSLVGCTSSNDKNGSNPSKTSGAESQSQGGEQSEGTKAENSESGDKPLVISTDALSQKFSPFFATSGVDRNVASMTSISLGVVDREGSLVLNGIEGETRTYNGTDYTYTGISDTTVTQNEDGTTTYNIKIKEGVKFSDGEELTADDVIFSYYVYCDPTYDGSTTLASQGIVGVKNYQANSTAAEGVTADQVNAKITEMPEALKTQIVETIITPTLKADMDAIIDIMENGSDDDKAKYTNNGELKDASEVMAAFYSLDESFTGAGVDTDTCLQTLVDQYAKDVDYKTLGTNYAGDETYFDTDVYGLAETVVIEELKAAGTGEEVPNIAGIKKLGDYEVEVTTTGYTATAIYSIIGSDIAPLHYYGDEAQYDYENNKFGFPREDLSIVKEKTTQPMGAGPYKFVKYENKVVYFEANENYWDGVPKTKEVQFMETSSADKVSGVAKGTIDISDPTGSKQVLDEIKGYNSNGELTGDVIQTNMIDNRGYGYIGLNADTINVAGEPGSEASKNLRKGIATILAVYRDMSINSYYGDLASVLQYPISLTSWASPTKSDEGYQEAFSVDVDGNPIYTSDMSQEDKYEAAKKAALGFFEAAGYTVENGKLTAAPEGAKLEYKIEIGADGQGDHPSFAILTAARTALGELGMTFTIDDLSNSAILWEHLDAGTQEMWGAAWQASTDPDMYQVYHSDNVTGQGGTDSNHYALADDELDAAIIEARTSDNQAFRKEIYKNCLDIILDWAVEIPVYQRKNTTIYSTQNINTDTLMKDETPYYTWLNEIHLIEMK